MDRNTMSIFESPIKNLIPEPWGRSAIIYKNDERKVEIGIFSVEPEKGMEMHAHENSDEFIYILEGESKFIIDNSEEKLTKGSAVLIPKEVEHKAFNDTQKANLCLYIVSPLKK